MFSRLALRSAQDLKPCLAQVIRLSSSVTQQSSTTRVTPQGEYQINPGKVRMSFIPEEWFQMFYPKTGVTGPYVFGVTLTTYLFSKEIIVCEHEFFSGVALGLVLFIIVKNFGPKVTEFLDDKVEATLKRVNGGQVECMTYLKEAIEKEKHNQWLLQGQTMLFETKRENVGLQLEAAYRQRLIAVHSQVKRKLDYQLETANVKNRLEQKHMVDWIVNNVLKSITPVQEAATLKRCLGDLKGLAAAQA